MRTRDQNERNPTLKDWSKLMLSMLLIFVFVFGIAPYLQHLPLIEEFHSHVQENEIDATALVYTESDEFGDADASIRDTMKY